jgi:RNA polymerase sigma factor (sigma-70 family)
MLSSVKVRNFASPFQNELELWKAFRSGNLEAFTLIYENYVQILYNYGCKLTIDKAMVEDGIQDLFIEIWKKKESLGDTNNIKYYLFKCLRRKLVHKIKESNTIDYKFLSETTEDSSWESNLIDIQQFQLQQAHLQKAFQLLTKRQKEAVFLKFYENLSFQEVASVMGLGIKSTYNLISKALDILRLYLRKLDLFWWLCVAGEVWFKYLLGM